MERERAKKAADSPAGKGLDDSAVAVPEEDVEAATKAIMTEAPTQARKDIVKAAIESVPEDVKQDVAMEAIRSLSPETQEEVLGRLQRLPRKDREQIAGLLLPDQPVTNRIWTIIVGAFALVFVLSAVALFVVALQTGEIQTLLTVVTTIAGILAGFISGRASSGGSS